jgi:hypothetical protein
VVNPAHQLRLGPVPPDGLVAGHQPGLGLAAHHHVPHGDDAAGVAPLSGGPVHAIGGEAEELAAVVVGDDSLDIVSQPTLLPFQETHKADTQLLKSPPEE